MAFDLNKNNGAVTESTGKPAAKSKFDLSKGEETPGKSVTAEAPKSKNLDDRTSWHLYSWSWNLVLFF